MRQTAGEQEKSSKSLVTNPLYENSDSESSEEDDGIVVISDTENGNNRTITISSDSDEPSPPNPSQAKSAQIRAIEQFFAQPASKSKKRKQSYYVEEFGSDYEENFLSESSDDSDGSDDSVEIIEEQNIALNISKPTQPDSYRYIYWL